MLWLPIFIVAGVTVAVLTVPAVFAAGIWASGYWDRLLDEVGRPW
jgi:hypothetical protein